MLPAAVVKSFKLTFGVRCLHTLLAHTAASAAAGTVRSQRRSSTQRRSSLRSWPPSCGWTQVSWVRDLELGQVGGGSHGRWLVILVVCCHLCQYPGVSEGGRRCRRDKRPPRFFQLRSCCLSSEVIAAVAFCRRYLRVPRYTHDDQQRARHRDTQQLMDQVMHCKQLCGLLVRLRRSLPF